MAQTIGRFEIRRELGRGAQSVVYLAWDPQLQREVAIKTMHFDESDVHLNGMLLTEARTVSKLRHANVVPIYDAGEQDGDPYLVFEYVEGPTSPSCCGSAAPWSRSRRRSCCAQCSTPWIKPTGSASFTGI
jgi:serine/threonine protein kinase